MSDDLRQRVSVEPQIQIAQLAASSTVTPEIATATTEDTVRTADIRPVVDSVVAQKTRNARRSKLIHSDVHPATDSFCVAYAHCEASIREFEERCDRQFNPVSVTFG